jgi:hypothetical protein
VNGRIWKDTAELIGIAAIVASLIFVGFQMKQEQEIAYAEALGGYSATSLDFFLAAADYSEILVKGNAGETLTPVESHKLRTFIEAAETRLSLEMARQHRLGSSLNSGELKFASFFYRNPAARVAWLQLAKDVEQFVDPLRTPESLVRTQERGSDAFRQRIKTHLARLDELYK